MDLTAFELTYNIMEINIKKEDRIMIATNYSQVRDNKNVVMILSCRYH